MGLERTLCLKAKLNEGGVSLLKEYVVLYLYFLNIIIHFTDRQDSASFIRRLYGFCCKVFEL